jgi:3-hydroxyisobutyrate dehydrogenase-like beta-hydroxyacid dehydrogenase
MGTVAVVGLGRMGSALARRLAGEGTDLVLHNRTQDRARSLASELGARAADTPAAAAGASDVAITMLADRPAVEAVWAGPDGLLAGAGRGSVLVDMSTVEPDSLHPYAARAKDIGVGILDAPVSGSVQLAESGGLTIMAGGEAADLERARPVLGRLATTIFHLGPLGSGSAMKLAVNAVIFALNNGVSEALVLAERFGIDRSTAYEVLARSAVGAPFVGYKRDAFVRPEDAPVGFSLDLARKDLDLIIHFARKVGVRTAQADTNAHLIVEAGARLGGERDFSAVATYLRDLASEGAAS